MYVPTTWVDDVTDVDAANLNHLELGLEAAALVADDAAADATAAAAVAAAAIPEATFNAKGDLLVASAADTAAVLAVGADGTVLTADAAEATGQKWVAPAVAATDGWTATGVALTFSAADAPTYVCTTAADLTGVIGVGDRIKLTHAAATKYFIVTAIAAGTITLYGGTDYTLAAGAITNPYYSHHKAPLGFPLSPIKWTQELKDTSVRAQVTPTQNAWYNPGSLSLAIPIGAWSVEYQAAIESNTASKGVRATLSTANNSESDVDFTAALYSTATDLETTVMRRKHLLLAAKTTHYLNIGTQYAAAGTIQFVGSDSPSIIRAVCAYL